MQHIVEDVDFLFIYEVRPREIDSICLLGAWLETQGYKVGYINTWDTMYHWHPEYRAKVAVLSACYNTPAYDYFTGHALSFEKVVNLQWEQVLMNSVAYSKVQTIWDFDGKAKEIRHVSWGENNRQYLQKKYGLGDDKMRVCGYLPLDFYRPELRGATMAKEQLFAKYGLDPSKKTLLFISSFADADKPKSEIDLQNGDAREQEDKRVVQSTSQRMIVEWFRKLAKEDPEIQIIYRPHPAEANNPGILQTAREVSNFHVITGESIRNWILNCDVMCNWQSTSMIELYASGKKTLILRPQEIPFLFAMPILEEGHYKAVTSYEELAAGIREENPEFPVEKDMLLQFYSMTEQPVHERVGQYLIDILKDPDYRCPECGPHSSPKGRVLHRAQLKFATAKARAAHGIWKLSGGEKGKDGKLTPRGAKIKEDYAHYCYYVQKMRLNRISSRELREKIDSYKAMIRKA